MQEVYTTVGQCSQAPAMPIRNTSRLDGLRVLVVDDNLDSYGWMTCLLELYGIEVHSTFTVHQALAAGQTHGISKTLAG